MRRPLCFMQVTTLVIAWAIFETLSTAAAPNANADGPYGSYDLAGGAAVAGADGQRLTLSKTGCIAIAVEGAKISKGRGATLDAARSDALAANGGGVIKQAMRRPLGGPGS